MKNVLRVMKRDLLRLLKAPAALVVVAALLVLPSLYTWFNVVGFWNPYENTGNLKVCVVNEDAGAATDVAGELRLGEQIVASLEDNHQLGWTFTTREDALERVSSGEAYAAFVIPSDFSENTASLLTGTFTKPEISYYVNEKLGPVSTKITDTGATTLDQTINSTFVATVSSVVADAVDTNIADSRTKVDAAKSSIAAEISSMQTTVADARSSISSLAGTASDASERAASAAASLQSAKDDIDTMSDALGRLSSLITLTQNQLTPFASSVASALDASSLLISQASAKANAAIGSTASAVVSAKPTVDSAISAGKNAVAQNATAIDQLKKMLGTLPSGDQKDLAQATIGALEQQNTSLGSSLADLETLSGETAAAAQSIDRAANSINDATQASLKIADDYRASVSSTTIPAVNGGLSQIAATCAGLSSTVASQKSLVDQTQLVLDQLGSTLSTTASALSQTDELLANLEKNLSTAQTDLVAISTSTAIERLLGDDGALDANKIADFMMSPTELKTESLYPVNAYGSSMAPLFINLTLWIGAFMLMVILRQEVDDEGIPNLTLSQRYLGRFGVLCIFAALQAAVCIAGNLIIGVQAVSAPLLFLTAVCASLTYLSIQFALSVTLQHIGKGICVIMVFMQIPGATGLYPIEMTPSFFQALYPFFPFTYGINAMRATIAGFYGNQWASYLGMLALFFIAFLALGLLARPYLTNVNRMFAKQIAASDILNGEDVQAPARRFRLTQLVQALSNREEYRGHLVARAEWFFAHYPKIKRAAFVSGLVIPAIAALALTLSEGEKVVLLTIWLVWLALVLIFLVALEFVRDSLERQLSLDNLSDNELRELFAERNVLDEGGAK